MLKMPSPTTTQNRSNALAWWSAVPILVSAFLLFQVQPVITKKILPWFGGSPAVWTTCVLFFQLVLLGGYAYAHWVTHQVQPRWQGVVHLAIVLIAVCALPIVPWEWWKPKDGDFPALNMGGWDAATGRGPPGPAVTAAEGLVAKRPGAPPDVPHKPEKPQPDLPPTARLRLGWLALAALASLAFLAITNHLCQDI